MRALTLVAGAALCACGTGPAPRLDDAGVRAFLASYDEPLRTAQPALLRARFHDDDRLRWYEDGALRYTSVDQMQQVLAQFGDAVTLRTRYHDVDVQMLAPDLAAVGAAFETTVEGMDAPFGFSGVTTMLVERRAGAWKIRHGHTSSERPGGR